MALGEYLGAGSGVTKLLYHLNGNANDSSGNSNNGTPTNITWVDGRLGNQAASFNGSTSTIGQTTRYSGLEVTNLTILAWIKRNAIGVEHTIFMYNRGGSSYIGAYDLNIWGNNKLGFSQQNGISAPVVITSTSSITNDGKWHLVGVSRNPSAGTTILFIDGISETFTGNTTAISYSGSSYGWGLGCYRGTSSYSALFNGQIDEVIVENRARTAEEMKKYYAYSQGRFAIL